MDGYWLGYKLYKLGYLHPLKLHFIVRKEAYNIAKEVNLSP